MDPVDPNRHYHCAGSDGILNPKTDFVPVFLFLSPLRPSPPHSGSQHWAT